MKSGCKPQKFTAIDLFAGCGGLTEGMKQAEFEVIAGIEIDENAALCYKLNHPETYLIQKDIRKVGTQELKKLLNGRVLHFLAACPPCQGFSSVRRLNRKKIIKDYRNNLITEFYRFVKGLMPQTIMFENVPTLMNYGPFRKIVDEIKNLGYVLDYKVVDVQKYGVPQRRKRLILVGSRLGRIRIAEDLGMKITVRDTIGGLERPETTNDLAHRIFAKHKPRIQKIITMIPKDGGSRKDLPKKYWLKCHKKENVGFFDIYGRLKWDRVSSTITGGCLNPSKGRFLHPEENRCITAREAALLQSFPIEYKLPPNISKSSLASLIGNALPPKFSKIQSLNIQKHLEKYNFV